jgi:hypothetical protein
MLPGGDRHHELWSVIDGRNAAPPTTSVWFATVVS